MNFKIVALLAVQDVVQKISEQQQTAEMTAFKRRARVRTMTRAILKL
jgi:hypothetical protein